MSTTVSTNLNCINIKDAHYKLTLFNIFFGPSRFMYRYLGSVHSEKKLEFMHVTWRWYS
jgi:hypothetical protein